MVAINHFHSNVLENGAHGEKYQESFSNLELVSNHETTCGPLLEKRRVQVCHDELVDLILSRRDPDMDPATVLMNSSRCARPLRLVSPCGLSWGIYISPRSRHHWVCLCIVEHV